MLAHEGKQLVQLAAPQARGGALEGVTVQRVLVGLDVVYLLAQRSLVVLHCARRVGLTQA